MSESHSEGPPAQHLDAENVLRTMGHHGAQRIARMSVPQVFMLAVMADAFITAGAMFSLLLGAGVESTGPHLLLQGLGFSTGFFFVVLASAILFTEANVTMPSTFLACRAPLRRIGRYWAIAWVGNLAGALLVGGMIALAQDYPADVTALLDETIDKKLTYREEGGAGSWFEIIVSGMLANWLVGMAAFFATMGRTIIGKYIPVRRARSNPCWPANAGSWLRRRGSRRGRTGLGRRPHLEHHPGRHRQSDRGDVLVALAIMNP